MLKILLVYLLLDKFSAFDNLKIIFIALIYRKLWYIANPIYFMIFGCTLNVNNQSDSYWQASIWLSAHPLYAQQPCVS